MSKKNMPRSVKAIVAVHSLIIAFQILFLFNHTFGLVSHRLLRHYWNSIYSQPFSFKGIVFFSCILVMIFIIYGFLRARPYTRNITITFWGLIILNKGINLLHPFTVPYMRGYQKLAVSASFAFLCLSIFLFYLALRPDVYEYCRPSDQDTQGKG